MTDDSADHDAHQEQILVAIVEISFFAFSRQPHQELSTRLAPVDALLHLSEYSNGPAGRALRDWFLGVLAAWRPSQD